MRTRTEKFMLLESLALYCLAYLFMVLFAGAYLSDTKRAVIDINRFGEANIEMLGIAIIFILSIGWLFNLFYQASLNRKAAGLVTAFIIISVILLPFLFCDGIIIYY